MGDIVRKLLSNSFVLFVIFIVIAIIIPLPSWLLDFMILLNISLSLIILVMTMFIKEALEFSVFPTVLLLTTVLRLSLNVSTTLGILSSGYAGEVISALGNFVMGGDAIVGYIHNHRISQLHRNYQGFRASIRGCSPLHAGRYAR